MLLVAADVIHAGQRGRFIFNSKLIENARIDGQTFNVNKNERTKIATKIARRLSSVFEADCSGRIGKRTDVYGP